MDPLIPIMDLLTFLMAPFSGQKLKLFNNLFCDQTAKRITFLPSASAVLMLMLISKYYHAYTKQRCLTLQTLYVLNKSILALALLACLHADVSISLKALQCTAAQSC